MLWINSFCPFMLKLHIFLMCNEGNCSICNHKRRKQETSDDFCAFSLYLKVTINDLDKCVVVKSTLTELTEDPGFFRHLSLENLPKISSME